MSFPNTSTEPITKFQDENRKHLPWSNFYFSPIHYAGLDWPTAEHPYQAMKTLDRDERAYIASLTTPGMAKRAGRKLTLRKDWDNVKIAVMYGVVQAKFYQNPDLADLLCGTYQRELVEGNHWGDTFWGVCDGVGRNELGKILMLVRDKLQYERMFP